jgi:hypothetical protein
MKCLAVVVALVLLEIGAAQISLLDDPMFRSIFRKIREFQTNFIKDRTEDEAYKMNLKMGVSW